MLRKSNKKLDTRNKVGFIHARNTTWKVWVLRLVRIMRIKECQNMQFLLSEQSGQPCRFIHHSCNLPIELSWSLNPVNMRIHYKAFIYQNIRIKQVLKLSFHTQTISELKHHFFLCVYARWFKKSKTKEISFHIQTISELNQTSFNELNKYTNTHMHLQPHKIVNYTVNQLMNSVKNGVPLVEKW